MQAYWNKIILLRFGRIGVFTTILGFLISSGIEFGSAENFSAEEERFRTIYTSQDLLNVSSSFKEAINKIVADTIRPALNSEQLATLNATEFEFPMQGGLLEFYANASGLEVTFPISSLLFLQDILAAYLWEDARHCDTNVFYYLMMLKYRGLGSFPQGKFPDPIEALGIPSPNPPELAEMDSQFGARFKRLMPSALAFIVAHEIGHVILHHQESNPENETAADSFAMGIFAHGQLDTSGITDFFTLFSALLPNQAESQGAIITHPPNAARILAIGMRLSNHPDQYFPNADSSDSRIQELKLLGNNLIALAGSVDNLEQSERLKAFALNMDPSELSKCHR